MDTAPEENGKKVLTMAEYIERETAIAWFMPYAHAGESIDADVVISDIKGMKAADVAPVRHGEWILGKDLPYGWRQILKNKYHLYCSECLGQAFNRSEDNDPDFDVDTPYCPFCGCCMDGGAD